MKRICTPQCFQRSVLCWLLTLVLIVLIFILPVNSQAEMRPFPPLFNAAKNRPVFTDPTDSTCGVPQRNAYCESNTFPSSVLQCTQEFCQQTCPTRENLPTAMELGKGPTPGFGKCVSSDMVNKRPGSPLGEFSTYFIKEGPNCFLTPSVTPSVGEEGAFTMTIWIWQQSANGGYVYHEENVFYPEYNSLFIFIPNRK